MVASVVATGVMVGLLFWAGRGTFVFSWLRYFILAFYMFGAWCSWQRRAATVVSA